MTNLLRHFAWLPLVAAPLGQVVAPSRGAESPLESGDIVSLSLVRPAATVVEHFRLDTVDWGVERARDDRAPIGIVRLVTGPDSEATLAGQAWRLEQEVTFFDAETKVVHAERLHPLERRLIWREVRESSGRTLLVEWGLHRGMRSAETVGGAVVRREHDISRGAFLPLSLVDQARKRSVFDGSFRVFDPLSRMIETCRLATWAEPTADSDDRHGLSLHRMDGTLVGRYLFDGPRLIAFQWQEGGPVAREISRNEYDRWLRAQETDEE